MPDWKHSQYFLRQADFLQAQPLECYLSFPSAVCPGSKLEPIMALPTLLLSPWFWADAPAPVWAIFGLKAFGVFSSVC